MFKLEVVPGELLIDCQDAVDLRNNLVHKGQRRVDSSKAKRMLLSIKEMCALLEDFTLK